jgi:hypothetical protein
VSQHRSKKKPRRRSGHPGRAGRAGQAVLQSAIAEQAAAAPSPVQAGAQEPKATRPVKDGSGPMRAREMPSRWNAIAWTVFCSIGLIMTIRWSPLVLVLLTGLTVAEARNRLPRQVKIQAAVGSIFAIAFGVLILCWDVLTTDLPTGKLAVLLGCCVLGLTLIGQALRHAARMQEKDHHVFGLYGLGAGCQLVAGANVLMIVSTLLLPSA